MRIAHLSDIHIRLKDRHEEYCEVFNNLYAELSKQQLDRILLVGDIVHSKITLSPECVSVAVDFLKKLSSIAPVDMIVGNHDMNMSNTDRMDSLTPIVEAAQSSKNFHINYMTGTGIYEISPHFSYGVYSLIDGGNIRLRPEDKKENHTYAALYHGVVSGSKLDNDYTLNDASTSLSTFDNFDFVFLGDIHKRQFLGDGNRVAYCGSLIQQNHGEDMDKGFLLWDIGSKDDFSVEFVKVKNDYAYYTIYGDDENGLPDLDLPSKTRIRVVWSAKANDISRAKSNRLNSEIRSKYNPLSVQLSFKPISNNKSGEVDVSSNINLADRQVQADLLRKWFASSNLDVPIEDLMDIDKEITDTITDSEYEDFSNSNWHLKKISMENFMSYAGSSEINFDSMRGVIGLFGDNTVGKSVVIDAVLYALFNKTTREVKNEDLVNKYTPDNVCRVRLQLEIRGVEYEIDRWTTRQYKKKSGKFINARTDVTLKRRYNEFDEWENLTETQRSETEKIIRNAVGGFDDFMITALSTQGGSTEFLKLGATPRSDAMLRMLGLDLFSKKHEFAKGLLKQVEYERKGLNRDNDVELLGVMKKKLDKLSKDLESKNKSLKSIKMEIGRLRSGVNKFSAMINSTIKIEKDSDTLEKEIEEIRNSIVKFQDERSGIRVSMGEIVSIVESLEKKFLFDERKLKVLYDTKDVADEIKKKISQNELEIESNKKVLKIYRNDLANENKCPVSDDARHTSCAYLKGYITKKDECLGIMSTVSDLQKENDRLLNELSRVDHVYGTILEQEKVMDRISKAYVKLNKMKSDILSIDGKIEVKNVSLNLVSSQLNIASNNAEIIKTNKKCKGEIKKLEDKILLKTNECESLEDEISLLKEKMVVVKRDISDVEKAMEKIAKSDKKFQLYNIYCNAMHRKGLPVDVLRTYIPAINYEINKILSDVVDFGVYLKIEEEETDIDIVMRYDGETDDTRPAQMASGMEKLLINMAIRYALLSVSNLNTPSSWFIDEGFGVLDADNLYSMSKFFENVKGVFRNIIIITHIDTLKDVANWVVNVEKTDGISRVNAPIKNI